MSFQYTRSIANISSCDVLVIGGGPAGVSAALSAARNHVDTLLVERYGMLGGMATMGMVGPFMTSYDGASERMIIKGNYDEIMKRAAALGGAVHPSEVRCGTSYTSYIVKGHDHCGPFDSETLKIVLEDMMAEAGVKVLFNTSFIDTVTENDTIKYVVVHNKSGISAIQPKIVIDCSGDADVAVAAGVETVLGCGPEMNNHMQPATLFFEMENVDSEKVTAYIDENRHLITQLFAGPFNWLVKKGRETGEWDISRNEIGMYETAVHGRWKVNTTRINDVDATDPAQLTAAQIDGRKQAQRVFHFIKKYIPGCENATFINSAPVLGIRESRHIVGQYVLDKGDIIACRRFEDTIMICSNSMDIHSAVGAGGEYITIPTYYGIPYRSLLPKNCENLLVAGRTISATSDAASSFRVMPPCFALGQAAGTAAAQSLGTQKSLFDVDIAVLQETLRSQGAVLE